MSDTALLKHEEENHCQKTGEVSKVESMQLKVMLQKIKPSWIGSRVKEGTKERESVKQKTYQ